MTQVNNRSTASTQLMEKELKDLVSSEIRTTPTLVSKKEAAADIGRMTAEALMLDYTETSKSFENLGKEIAQVSKCCENYYAELKEILAYMNKVAIDSRERAATIFKAIEESAKTTADVRKQAEELAKRVSTTPIVQNNSL